LASWSKIYPYTRGEEKVDCPALLLLEGQGFADGRYELKYIIQHGRGTLVADTLRADVTNGSFAVEVSLRKPEPQATHVTWTLRRKGAAAISGRESLAWSRFSGHVRYRDPALGQTAYIELIPSSFGCPGGVLVPVDTGGAFDAKVPARVYRVLNAVSTGYACKNMERWGWDYDLTRDRNDEFVIGRTELYGIQVLTVPTTTTKTLFILFRPSCLTRLLRFDADGDGWVSSQEKAAVVEALKSDPFAIAPRLKAEDVKIWVNGHPLPVIRLDQIPEYDGQGVWQTQVIVQVDPAREVKISSRNEIKVEVESRDTLHAETITDFGQGSVGYFPR
jgi:hypothetical protein